MIFRQALAYLKNISIYKKIKTSSTFCIKIFYSILFDNVALSFLFIKKLKQAVFFVSGYYIL